MMPASDALIAIDIMVAPPPAPMPGAAPIDSALTHVTSAFSQSVDCVAPP
jgi:hypothetical protein